MIPRYEAWRNFPITSRGLRVIDGLGFEVASMNEDLLPLPIGIQDFGNLRRRGYLYVDKTARLLELIKSGERYFLSRPRRFGKSLTLSTLDAMFSGRAELFQGLAAETWVAEQASHPSPVLRLDMSAMETGTVPRFERSLRETLRRAAIRFDVKLQSESLGGMFQDMLSGLNAVAGPVTVLVDEYDKPILDNLDDPEAAEAMRGALRSFYTVLKSCDEYLRFVMLTGISKFSKVGVFSAMNNLQDISAAEQYGDLVGYTRTELEGDFAGWIRRAAEMTDLTQDGFLVQMKDYYDGFCFDGRTRLYNPFSIMQCLSKARFSNYWYESGSPSFIVSYMERRGIQDPDIYRHMEVPAGFADSREIERARPESFLYQSGYLTIESWVENSITLDYPNREVLDSIARMYLELVYHVEGYAPLGSGLWRALKDGDIPETIRLYNVALAGLPYDDFAGQGEMFYRSLFLMLLRGAGITANGEVHTSKGRSDVLIQVPERVVVLEFKLASRKAAIPRLREEGKMQIEERCYARPYDEGGRAVEAAVVVVDSEGREAVL